MTVEKLKIAMLSVHSCPVGNLGAKDTGGMSVYVREVARNLGRQGHWVDVYTRVHGPKDRQIVALGPNARLIHLKAGQGDEIHKLLVYCHLPEFACSLENFRKQNSLEYDLVFSHYWLSGLVGERLQQWWQVPHLITFHTLGAVKNAIGIGEDEPELRIESERHLIRDCHHIIATTQEEKEDLIRYYSALPESTSIIPCGVDLELFRPVDKDITKRKLGFNNLRLILFVGRIEPLKGIDRLIEAMTYLKSYQNLRLGIIGGDGYDQHEIKRLKKLSQELNLEDKVIFLGAIGQEKLLYLYSAADVSVIASYYESFGLVILESLACGTPVVTTSVGGADGIIHQAQTGYVVANNTPWELADKIALLLARPKADKKSISLIRNSVAGFGWDIIAGAIANECQAVLRDYLAKRG